MTDLPGERWLGLAELPGYEVSDHGRLISRFGRGMHRDTLSSEPQLVGKTQGGRNCEYRRIVRKRRDGTVYRRYIHDLVLCLFGGPKPFPDAECRHKDGDPNNNHIDNLCWGSRRDNNLDAVRHGTAYLMPGQRHPGSKLTESDVATIRKLRTEGAEEKTLAKRFGVAQPTISKIVLGQRWKHVPQS